MKTLPANRLLKSILTAIILGFGALATTPHIQAQEPTKYVEGQECGIPDCKVVQALKDGLLLYAERIDAKPGMASVYAQDPVVILLTGYPDSVVDGEWTTYCVAKYAGTFQYKTTSGATKTVRKFTFVRTGMK